jgi:hypothetical protein
MRTKNFILDLTFALRKILSKERTLEIEIQTNPILVVH